MQRGQTRRWQRILPGLLMQPSGGFAAWSAGLRGETQLQELQTGPWTFGASAPGGVPHQPSSPHLQKDTFTDVQ